MCGCVTSYLRRRREEKKQRRREEKEVRRRRMAEANARRWTESIYHEISDVREVHRSLSERDAAVESVHVEAAAHVQYAHTCIRQLGSLGPI